MVHTVQIEDHIVALLLGLVRTDLLDELAIARTPAIGHDHPVDRAVLGSDALQSNFD
jgi:hypothetical protein